MKTIKGIRQGDLAFIKIQKLPVGLKKSDSNIILLSGSGGNAHSFTGGAFYPKVEGEFIIGYLKTKDTVLLHKEHGEGKGELKKAKIDDGLYAVRRQVEMTHEGMRQVID
ncbi:MAG: hypothetical protein U1E54_03405 [Candidatus Levybacteria bacterium]|nr:hypothetical protein [Candidatus Levybacteria bacterium]